MAPVPGSLAVTAVSGDTFAPTVFTASGFAAVPQPLVAGAPYKPVPAVAQAGPDQNAAVGALVTLDGFASTGALTHSWTNGPNQTGIQRGTMVTLDGSLSS